MWKQFGMQCLLRLLLLLMMIRLPVNAFHPSIDGSSASKAFVFALRLAGLITAVEHNQLAVASRFPL
jgi:hypothetical protein